MVYTKCDQTKYLKEGACVDSTACTGATFPKADTGAGNRCVPCGDEAAGVADCKTCTKESTTLKCLTCSDPKKPSIDGTKCVTCAVTNCATCSADNVCEVCTDGYRKTDSNCEKCTPEHCKACASDINTCTECVEGYTLDGGKCVPPNTNRSALSTGAIAGISVAAVVVVVGGPRASSAGVCVPHEEMTPAWAADNRT